MSGEAPKNHVPGEATPQEVALPAPPSPPPPAFGLHDSGWSNDQWLDLLKTLVEGGVGTWKDIAALVLGHLNPSQVGTSLASSKGFKRRYGKGKTMRLVMEWVNNQTGRCADCGARLELQADHVKGREEFTDVLDADFIENMTLRCRRCNVIRRPSHKFGGLTFLTAESALMWILFVIRPRTFRDYIRLCRLYGMTMSDIRMEEAWAMAHWLARATPPAFGIEDDEKSCYDLILWPDSAVTRVDVGIAVPAGAERFATNIPGDNVFGFLALQADGRVKFYEHPLSFIPFSTYDLGGRAPQSLAIHYSPPDRKNRRPQQLSGLPPRNLPLLTYCLRMKAQRFQLGIEGETLIQTVLPDAPIYGKLIRLKGAPASYRLHTCDVEIKA